ncbi:MAG TPA: YdeI/OmpD-associated family protein [Ferruginibacter sp.]|jgi:hypothetical protein|nr:YdeI/OmpD-associated family protein [Ferruginibacter sp.]
MNASDTFTFSAQIEIIDINPYVLLPASVLDDIFRQANKNKGSIPIKGMINQHLFIQTLVKFRGEWRLYLNTPMRIGSNTKVGDTAIFTIAFDPDIREIIMNPKLKKALKENVAAKNVFNSLRPSLQKEIVRYISFLKTEESIDRNVTNAIQFLLGKKRFIGRDKPQGK